MIPHGPLKEQLQHAWDSFGADYGAREKITSDVELVLGWDGSPDLKSGAPTIFLLWLFELNGGSARADVSLLERAPSELSKDDAFAMFDAFKEARKRLRELIPFPPQVPWGLVHVLRKGGKVFPVATGMYPGISLMNANLDLEKPDIMNLTCRIGSAYVALHELSDPPMSWTVTPIGQTDREDLPYLTACTELFAKRELKPLPITDEQLAEVETSETVLEFELPD